ncbi:hypothetical protein P280DRAFT_263677 [Massarina eburnea CBS 473.64]|uniref:Uncharacterized protein n=1 Tax=Massarina eburnea CBS 473.64 TaxID=1395130 RepID=A0A6A6S6I3_9PLEO|nr:hypothetical protein P280DRAFT_263677 [Massarina eburnea CBS 473.64]
MQVRRNHLLARHLRPGMVTMEGGRPRADWVGRRRMPFIEMDNSGENHELYQPHVELKGSRGGYELDGTRGGYVSYPQHELSGTECRRRVEEAAEGGDGTYRASGTCAGAMKAMKRKGWRESQCRLSRKLAAAVAARPAGPSHQNFLYDCTPTPSPTLMFCILQLPFRGHTY